jgi:hypothetical protein
LFLVIISTAFWASSIESADDWADFDRAVDDVTWVISQIMDVIEKLPPVPQPAPPEAPKQQAPSKGGKWMVRGAEKRVVKPSRKMKEVMSG